VRIRIRGSAPRIIARLKCIYEKRKGVGSVPLTNESGSGRPKIKGSGSSTLQQNTIMKVLLTSSLLFLYRCNTLQAAQSEIPFYPTGSMAISSLSGNVWDNSILYILPENLILKRVIVFMCWAKILYVYLKKRNSSIFAQLNN
jgi:hypothetical protein